MLEQQQGQRRKDLQLSHKLVQYKLVQLEQCKLVQLEQCKLELEQRRRVQLELCMLVRQVQCKLGLEQRMRVQPERCMLVLVEHKQVPVECRRQHFQRKQEQQHCKNHCHSCTGRGVRCVT